MPTNATVANTPQILKEIWEDDLHEFFYREAALLAHLEKRTDWDGLIDNVSLQYGGMAGRSHQFSAAQNAKSPTRFLQMNVPVRENYVLWSVDHMLITLSRRDRGALVRALANNTEAAVKKLKRSMCWGLWRNGGGAVGKISAISGSTFTLTDINDVRNYDIDDVVQLSADDGTGGGGVLNAGASLTVNDCPFLRGKLVSVRWPVASTVKVVTHGLGTPAAFMVVRANYDPAKAGPTFAEGDASDQAGLDPDNQIAIACSVVCNVDLWFYPRASRPLA